MIMIIININIITNLLYNICFEDELFYILNQEDVKRIMGVKFMLYIILTEILVVGQKGHFTKKRSSLVKFSKVKK